MRPRHNPFHQILFITDDLLLVSTYTSGIFFVSLSKKQIVAALYGGHYLGNNLKLINHPTCIILPDGRICVEGSNSCSIFDLPLMLRARFKSFANRMLMESKERNSHTSNGSLNRPNGVAHAVRTPNFQTPTRAPAQSVAPAIVQAPARTTHPEIMVESADLAVEDGNTRPLGGLRLLQDRDAVNLYDYELLNSAVNEQKGETNIPKAQLHALRNEMNVKIYAQKG